jgi:exopolyphosphatase/guanosine-5'-triphosphate,3'-diphosphate pyrophosphatase
VRTAFASGDIRERTIERLVRRYDVDAGQTARVNEGAQKLWSDFGNTAPDAILSWAADLHEIGMAIAHEDYHRHSAYIVEHSDLPGFSERERYAIQQLVLGHTGSLKKLDRSEFGNGTLQRLLCIRIAAIFAHGRNTTAVAATLAKKNGGYVVKVSEALRAEKPLTAALLDEEIERCQKWGVELTLRETQE